MGDNILSKGKETLEKIKEQVILLEECNLNKDRLKITENNLSKDIQALESEIEEKINITIKMRKKEIEDTFDSQLKIIKSKKKEVKDKREKKRNKKRSKRIKEETAGTKEENKQIKKELKMFLRNNKIKAIVNSDVFLAIYSPKTLKDILIIIFTCILTLLVLPTSVYYIFFKENQVSTMVIIYTITVIVSLTFYFLLQKLVKEKSEEHLDKVKAYRKKIYLNKKKVQKIKRKITKDKDDSQYNLEKYDLEISEIEEEEKIVLKEKNEATLEFTNNTSKVISSEIKNEYNEKLKSIKENYEQTYSELRQIQEQIKTITLNSAKEYEPFIGKEILKVDILNELIEIIEEGMGQNISEAIAIHKKGYKVEQQGDLQ